MVKCKKVSAFVSLMLLCLCLAEEPTTTTTVQSATSEPETTPSATLESTTTVQSKASAETTESKHETYFKEDNIQETFSEPVDKNDLITVKKEVGSPLNSQIPPWDHKSTIGKPPPTRPPYK